MKDIYEGVTYLPYDLQLENIPTIGNFNKDNVQKYLQENADINDYYKHIKTNK